MERGLIMSRNDIDIVLITYNRATQLNQTLKALLAPESPVRDFPITIMDNASTDHTSQVVACQASNKTNIQRHRDILYIIPSITTTIINPSHPTVSLSFYLHFRVLSNKTLFLSPCPKKRSVRAWPSP